MGDDFDLRRYFLSISDPEERAHTIHESGWAGHPDIEDIEAPVARMGAGAYQNLLASFRKPPPPTPKRAFRLLERVRLAHPQWFDAPRQGLKASIDATPVETSEPAEIDTAPPRGAAADVVASGSKSASPPPKQVLIPPPRDYPPAPGSFQDFLGRYLYENQARIWPHIKGEVIPRPAGYVPKPAPPVTATKSSDLTGEQVVRLYRAIAFAMWQHGAIMNTHVVILWETLWVHDHKRATMLLSEYFNQAKKWAAVGTVGVPRQRRRARTGEAFDRFVYAHECGGEQGFHSHILCTVPQPTAKAFAAWSRKTLARLARHHGDGRTVRVVASNARDKDAAVTRCWSWFRYITKQLTPNVGWGPVDGPFRSLREIFKVWPYRTARPVACAQMVGGSRDIWTKAQRAAGFQSALERGEFNQIYDGQELWEWRRREE